MNSSPIRFTIRFVLASALLGSTVPLIAAVNSAAPTQQDRHEHWRQTHPARAKDNDRIHHQRKMLNQDLKSGKITQDQYNAQNKQLTTIKHEEKLDAKANDNGGHLTGGQQQAIKQQLDESHKDINQDVKNDVVAK